MQRIAFYDFVVVQQISMVVENIFFTHLNALSKQLHHPFTTRRRTAPFKRNFDTQQCEHL